MIATSNRIPIKERIIYFIFNISIILIMYIQIYNYIFIVCLMVDLVYKLRLSLIINKYLYPLNLILFQFLNPYNHQMVYVRPLHDKCLHKLYQLLSFVQNNLLNQNFKLWLQKQVHIYYCLPFLILPHLFHTLIQP